MRCTNCKFDNPSKAKFCIECGSPIEFRCPNCSHITSANGKFCMECGFDLRQHNDKLQKQISFEDKLDKLQRYLPTGIANKILSQKNKLEGERRQVTVLFCDLVGFTALVETLGSEEAYSLMDRVYEALIHKVHEYEGTVNEMTGDGVMALYGAPLAIEDAPQRAVRSAHSIHREIKRLSDELTKNKSNIPQLKMRIGINTGEVVVGTLGNDLRVDFKVVGDTVNLASRVEGLAEPGTTYVTAATFRLTEGFFRFERLGRKIIKGKTESIEVYRVIAPDSMRTRFDVNAEQGLTPFMGRQRELELLIDVYERVKNNRGQAASIVADAGMGKSRLLYEFRKAMANEDVTFLEGKCLSYSRGISYHPVIDLIKGQLKIKDTDGDQEVRNKISKGLKELEIEETSILPCLLELLSIEGSGIDQLILSPESKKDIIIQALTFIILKQADIRPVILAVEDLHWIDKSSESVLKDLLNRISGAKILLVFTYRTEYLQSWAVRSYHTHINLNRISNREARYMISYLLDNNSVGSSLEDLILEKTEGIPFFIEEFLKSLKDLGLIQRQDNLYTLNKNSSDISIPSTIQDIIMTRVDTLTEGAKKILQIGSVIEREFSYNLIKKLTDIPEKDHLNHLMEIKEAELLYERGIFPKINYVFKHALTREVIYDSILSQKRKGLHTAVGQAMEKLYQSNLAEQLGTLCDHFIAGENYEKAEKYAELSARKAQKTGSIQEAITQGKKRIACLEELPLTNLNHKKRIDARTVLALNFSQLNNYSEAKATIEPIIELSEKIDYKKRQCQIKTILGTYYGFVKENFPESYRFYEEALVIANEINDVISLSLTSFWYGANLAYNREFEKATAYMQKFCDICAASRDLSVTVHSKAAFIYFCLSFPGKLDEAFQASNENIQLAESVNDSLSKGGVYTSHGVVCYFKGLFDEAEKYLIKGIHFCERVDERQWRAGAYYFLGEVYFETENFLKAEKSHEKGYLVWKNSNQLPSLAYWLKAGLMRDRSMMGSHEINLKSLYINSTDNRLKITQSLIDSCIGATLANVNIGHLSEAQAWIQKAIEIDYKNGQSFLLGRDYIILAKCFKINGDLANARESFQKALNIFKECGADGWVEKYEIEIKSCS